LALALSLMPAVSNAGVFVSVGIAPPAIPVYAQPICPGAGYLWTPGYWAYGDAGYYWVPGVWVRPPRIGVLWTPGYWGWSGGAYVWNAGYWGPHVGFYGGVNYGFGYGGAGFAGGRWAGGVFAYNSAVANINTTVIHNSYHETVVVNNVHTSYNGGTGGVSAQPNSAERSAMRDSHVPPTAAQNSHHDAASHDRSNLASANHGHPTNAAMSRPRTASAPGANHSSNGSSAANVSHTAAAKPAASRPAPAANRPTPANKPASGGGAGKGNGGSGHSSGRGKR
jgi:hypothetical protein